MAQVRGWVAPLLFVVLLAAFAAGIWGAYRAAFPGQGLHRVSGVYESRYTDRMISVRHERIPGVMDQMNFMVFTAESKELLDRGKIMPGDRVRLCLRSWPDGLLIVDIPKLE